jgi:hypothetical protein
MYGTNGIEQVSESTESERNQQNREGFVSRYEQIMKQKIIVCAAVAAFWATLQKVAIPLRSKRRNVLRGTLYIDKTTQMPNN